MNKPFSKLHHLTQLNAIRRKKSFRINRVEAREYSRLIFAEMLREAYGFDADGDARVSVTESSRIAAEELGISPMQVRNLLNMHSTPGFDVVVSVATKIGIGRTIWICTLGNKTKEEVAEIICR